MAVDRHWRFALLGLIATAAFAAQPPDIEFAGILRDAGGPRLCLINHASGELRWIRVGERFGVWQLQDYDPRQESVRLVGSTGVRAVTLTGGHIAVATSALSPEQVQAITRNLRLLWTAARIHFLEDRGHYVTLEDLVGPDKPIAQLPSIAGEDYSGLTIMKAETERLTVAVPTGERVSFSPREKLGLGF